MPRRPARLRPLAALLPAVLIVSGCAGGEGDAPRSEATPAIRRVRVRDLIDRLRSTDAGDREAAERQLMTMGRAGFPPKDGVRLLRAAAEAKAGARVEGRPSARGILVRAAAERPGPDDRPVVVELYARYDGESRRAALELLARLPGRDAAEALIRLVRAHARGDGPLTLPVGALCDRPRHADVYFPALLDYLDRSDLRPGVCRIAAAFAAADLLDGRLLRPHADRFADLLESRLDILLDPNGPGEAAEPSVHQEACAILDLSTLIPTPEIEGGLRRALAGREPELSAHAAVALLRQDRPVEPEDLVVAAERPEVHAWLWGRLKDLDQLDALPERYRTQAALAESELVAWLAQAPDLGRPPDAIEPAGDLVFRAGFAAPRIYYLFRFRVDAPENLADRGWMAGWVSYPPGREPALGGNAGSRFVPWDDRTARGHVAGGQPAGDDEPEE